MKSRLITLICFMLIIGSTEAQNISKKYIGPSTTNRTVIAIQPLSLFVGGGEMAAEHMYTKNKSIRVQLGYFVREDFAVYNADFEAFRAELQWRYYLNDDPAKGNFNDLYVAPYLQYKQTKLSNIPTFTTPGFRNSLASTSGVGLLVGYQMLLERNITLDFFGGGGLVSPIITTGINDIHIPFMNPYKRGIIIRFGMAIGLAI